MRCHDERRLWLDGRAGAGPVLESAGGRRGAIRRPGVVPAAPCAAWGASSVGGMNAMLHALSHELSQPPREPAHRHPLPPRRRPTVPYGVRARVAHPLAALRARRAVA